MIILIHGPMGCGKSEIAKIIQANVKEPVAICPFAGPLKEAARQLGWDGKKDAKGRRCLQILGTQVGRQCIDPDIWTKKWLAYVSVATLNNTALGPIVVCDDLRFMNEYTAGRSLGAVIIEVTGRNYGGWLKRFRMRWLPWTLHASERPLKVPFDHVIDNSGDFRHLELQVIKILRENHV